ncbi:MAG: EAL domain-containing protein [Cohaesibacter sp.]|jgi:diguanylate cyclase (GGDEF)-like protein/PAS domain S-box-containing protein|nr:EAL domain-containing protein [Cohaesibacter sp.]
MANILIVDDHSANRLTYSCIAETLEETTGVFAVSHPQQALDWLSEHEPDLIITGFMMPGMNADDFIHLVREKQHLCEVPIIVITMFEDKELRIKALDAGATDFLLSPVDHREFRARARNLLHMHRQSQLVADRAKLLEQSLSQSQSNLATTTRKAESRLANVIDTIPIMISATDLEGRFLFMNVYKAKYVGLEPEEVIGKNITDVLGEYRGESSRTLDKLVISSGKPVRPYEEEIYNSDGGKRIFLTTKSPLTDGDNEIIGVVTNSQDITDRKAAENHLHHLAHHDSLTGLANRTLLRDRVDREIGRCRRGDGRFAIHLIDLDGFKKVNDLNGHAVGDELLVKVGQQLQSIAGRDDLVTRLGGDEFAILQANAQSDKDIADLGEAIKQALPKAIEALEAASNVTGSVGIAVHPEDGNTFECLLRNADLAMYRSKAAKGNKFSFFSSNVDEREKEESRLDDELRQALQKGLFELYYQPQVDLHSGEVLGCEALLRMHSEYDQIIPPSHFLARAERNGMIIPINEWVLRTACRQGAAWRKAGLPDMTIGVNLSPVQFQQQSVPLLVGRILAETGYPAHLLDLELTESIVLHDTDAVAFQLAQLRQLGVKVSIDDFGTGCSSLSYVKHFAVDRLKIDQSFVRDMKINPSDAAIVRATISLGHSLGMEVIAEGVEDLDVAELLAHEHCNIGQGYLFGRPKPAQEMEALIKPRQQKRAAS